MCRSPERGPQLSGAASTSPEPPPCHKTPERVLARNSQQKNSSNVPPGHPQPLTCSAAPRARRGQLQAALASLAAGRGNPPRQGRGQRGFARKEHQTWRPALRQGREPGRGRGAGRQAGGERRGLTLASRSHVSPQRSSLRETSKARAGGHPPGPPPLPSAGAGEGTGRVRQEQAEPRRVVAASGRVPRPAEHLRRDDTARLRFRRCSGTDLPGRSLPAAQGRQAARLWAAAGSTPRPVPSPTPRRDGRRQGQEQRQDGQPLCPLHHEPTT